MMIHENTPDFGKPCVDIEKDFSTIRLDAKMYDFSKAKDFLSGFPEIRCLDDSGSLVIFIDEKDAGLLRENTLNLCNLLFENCLRVR